MAIYSVIVCDVCGTYQKWFHISKKHIFSFARLDGWSIGEKIKCPDCKKARA